MTLEQSIEYLKADGWLEYNDPLRRTVRAFAKIIPTPSRCRLNRNRAGINVRCYAGMLSDRPSFDLDLSGELPDQTWVNLHRYALPNDILKVLELVPQLVKGWECMVEAAGQPALPDDSTKPVVIGYTSAGHQPVSKQNEENEHGTTTRSATRT